MSVPELSNAELVKQLSQGWSSESPQLAEFQKRFKLLLKCDISVKPVLDNALQFTADLGALRFRGSDETPCWLIAGDVASASQALSLVGTDLSSPGHITLVFAFSDAAYLQARAVIPVMQRCVLLSPSSVVALLNSTEPVRMLRTEIQGAAPMLSLIPYNILMSAQGSMFFGRTRELRRLRDQDDVSFAIVGPSKIGKTSLMKEYKRSLQRENSPRAKSLVEIDFMNLADKRPPVLVHYIVMRIDGTRRFADTQVEDFGNFLKRARSRHGQPLELLCDEVDEVCNSTVFQVLGEAAKDQTIRLILGGRSVLFKSMHSFHHQLSGRLIPLQLQPLDDASATQLILEPIEAIGLSIADKSELVSKLLDLTGRRPDLIQFYCRKLMENAIDQNSLVITNDQIDLLEWDSEVMQYVMAPLEDLTDPETRLVALWLLQSGDGCWTYPTVQSLTARNGRVITFDRIRDICNDLYVHNILSFHDGSYQISNRAMIHYARKMGHLDAGLRDALRNVRKATA